MKIKPLHSWPCTPKVAIALQQKLAAQVRLRSVSIDVRIVAGTDVAFSADGRRAIAGVVVWDLATRTVIEQKLARVVCRFPYIPGLLSFREMPAVLAAFRKLRAEPQVVLCDAQGLAHPRRVGLACHLGLWLERPTVGCAKSRLCGTYMEPPVEKDSSSSLLLEGEQVGVVLRTRTGVKPIFVSPGHLCDHESAVRFTLAATTRFRLPEPTRLAHQLVTRARTAP